SCLSKEDSIFAPRIAVVSTIGLLKTTLSFETSPQRNRSIRSHSEADLPIKSTTRPTVKLRVSRRTSAAAREDLQRCTAQSWNVYFGSILLAPLRTRKTHGPSVTTI